MGGAATTKVDVIHTAKPAPKIYPNLVAAPTALTVSPSTPGKCAAETTAADAADADAGAGAGAAVVSNSETSTVVGIEVVGELVKLSIDNLTADGLNPNAPNGKLVVEHGQCEINLLNLHLLGLKWRELGGKCGDEGMHESLMVGLAQPISDVSGGGDAFLGCDPC